MKKWFVAVCSINISLVCKVFLIQICCCSQFWKICLISSFQSMGIESGHSFIWYKADVNWLATVIKSSYGSFFVWCIILRELPSSCSNFKIWNFLCRVEIEYFKKLFYFLNCWSDLKKSIYFPVIVSQIEPDILNTLFPY